ncbi:unnamed protein product [Penicillium nalgiovense]|uniref:Uncharacterized protein n=1 Tax=Penicillium nalgiovense TaxID=60175 RepID=A0A9W4I044_PENNA|nr:unnamed protein product [Penicillium nalgiovense]CAG8007949.1 unnamed protein product [Penicillium nalgiovense]CAG8068064.1 unnamed protein product [Penicillium nalgiovense]CAG8085763.1 unnamed protein product [Penicillium nalgiovense]CAG8090352.1 unnamed protein product [Penicillium nalgiovense]
MLDVIERHSPTIACRIGAFLREIDQNGKHRSLQDFSFHIGNQSYFVIVNNVNGIWLFGGACIKSVNGDPRPSSQPSLPGIDAESQKQRATSESLSFGAAACGSTICGMCHGSCLRRAPYINPILSFPP